MWRKQLDQFVSVFPVESSRILPLVLSIPGYPLTAHICVYLPQRNLESQFIEELSNLEVLISSLDDKYPGISIYIRGDANSSIPVRSFNKRDAIFKTFYEKLNFSPVFTHHKTYHHFNNGRDSDSSIDILLYRCSSKNVE